MIAANLQTDEFINLRASLNVRFSLTLVAKHGIE
jgi:hypothetical protein